MYSISSPSARLASCPLLFHHKTCGIGVSQRGVSGCEFRYRYRYRVSMFLVEARVIMTFDSYDRHHRQASPFWSFLELLLLPLHRISHLTSLLLPATPASTPSSPPSSRLGLAVVYPNPASPKTLPLNAPQAPTHLRLIPPTAQLHLSVLVPLSRVQQQLPPKRTLR